MLAQRLDEVEIVHAKTLRRKVLAQRLDEFEIVHAKAQRRRVAETQRCWRGVWGS